MLDVKERINLEDLLWYADDTLVICDTLEEVSRVIKAIRDQNQEHNMKLNKKIRSRGVRRKNDEN